MRRILLICSLALVVLAACGGDDDGGAVADAPDTTEDAAATDDTAMAADDDTEAACSAYREWESTGDNGALEDVRAATASFDSGADISDAIDAIQTMATDTADQQAAYEGAVDFIRGELITAGCDLD